MIPKECKRLAEVDFPIAVVSKHAAREKSIRHGHPSTLHLWWARRPLAACRSMLLALLLPDPCDPYCPGDFKAAARDLLAGMPGSLGTTDESLRKALLRFIGDFANWDMSANAAYLEAARGLVKAAHPKETPLVVDPFAGGGSIPLEALRVGCDAFASDLNPVACLILKVMLEDIPRHGPELAEELRRVGKEIKEAAEKELAEFYPADPDGARPIAYLWARTVRCESPGCGAEIPLARSFWLCKKARRRRALRPRVVREPGVPPRVELDIYEPAAETDVAMATVSRARARCLCCGVTLHPDRVRGQLAAQCGGADVIFDERGTRTGGARLLAVVTLADGTAGRRYRTPVLRDYEAVHAAKGRLASVVSAPLPCGLRPVPDEPTPAGGGSGAGRAFSVQRYGMMRWGDLFTARQTLTMATYQRFVSDAASVSPDASLSLALAASRFADICNASCQWKTTSTQAVHMYTRAALPMVWDFAEPAVFAAQSGDFETTLRTMIRVTDGWPGSPPAEVQLADAGAYPLPEQSATVWFTDPPYYDAVPYAELSDFFFVWLKRVLPMHPLLRDPFDSTNPLTPKAREAVQDETKRECGRPKDRLWFEDAMARAFAAGSSVLRDDGVGSVVFAHKTTEGWEALLSGMIRGGWIITASWPIATEMGTRLRAHESAALATSIHLVCRPRSGDENVGDWSEVLAKLPERVGEWMERLQREGVRGADLVFACIGPALELYSKHSAVLDNEDRPIPLGGNPEAKEPHERGFLAYVWETVGRLALEHVLGTAEAQARNGGAGALEEDARLTALFLWALQSTNGNGNGNGTATDEPNEDDSGEDEDEAPAARKTKGFALIFDVVRRFAQPLGIHLDEWEGRVIETEKGVVKLLAVTERARQLFGEDGAQAVASKLESGAKDTGQLSLFPDMEPEPRIRAPRRGATGIADGALRSRREATTLDRVHAAMLLQRAGHANALRALISAERERGPEFMRLSNALSALYPRDSEEKRLVDAMLVGAPR